jgi:C-terminal peptidase prc
VLTGTPPAEVSPEARGLSRARRYAIFNQAWTLVRDRYVHPDFGGVDWEAVGEEYAEKVTSVEEDEAFYDLMREMIELLDDEHSVFLSPESVALEEAFYEGLQISGGIGVYIVEEEGDPVLVHVVPGGPAFEAGLQSGEVIVAVDGTPLAQFSGFEEARLAIIGEVGTDVVLTVRGLDGQEREVDVTRAVVDFDDVVVRGRVLEGTGIGLVTMVGFDVPAVPEKVRDLMAGFADRGPLDGLILDLRANPGGLTEVMLETLSLFIPGGSIGRRAGRDEGFDLLIPEGATMPDLEGLPVVVLIGPYTQSAGECFAAGIQLHGRAVVVGLPSAGNTEFISWHGLSDGSELQLAEWVYELPDGTRIEGQGVQPDRIVELDWWSFGLANDPQIQAAVEVLSTD